MKERPILFNGDMVRAMLDGRKTQTRRPVKYTPILEKDKLTNESKFVEMRKYPNDVYYAVFMNPHADNFIFSAKSPYGEPGDRLWVRETFSKIPTHSGSGRPESYNDPSNKFYGRKAWYRVDNDKPTWGNRWIPSIHMPRWASRIDLRITGVRVERVQDIDANSAYDEGVWVDPPAGVNPAEPPEEFDSWSSARQDEWINGQARATYMAQCIHCEEIVKEFAKLWNSCYGDGAWERNDWVWVYDFEVVKPEGK